MGKSAKKSTKVDAAAVATAPVISAAKGKRGAEKVVEKVSAKKLKKNDGTAQAIEKLKSETKTQKKSIKKKESSSSEDESSESEEEQIKAVKPSTNKHAFATNGSAKKDKRISSSESDSSDDSDSEKDTKPKAKAIAPSAKKTESSSDSDSSDDSDSEEDTKPKAKVIAPVKKVESSSDSDSDSGSDSDVPKAIQGKKVASKADTSSDSSSEEDNDKKTTVAVKKPSAAAKKKDDSSSDEDDDTSSEDSSEEDKTSKVAKVPITGSKNVPVASKNTESSDSSDDSESDEEQAAKKPTSAAVTKQVAATKQSEQSSDDEESSEDDDEDDDEDEKPSKGQKKNEKDVEMVDAVTTPKTVKKAPQTPVTTTPAQSGGSKTLFVGNLPYNVEQADVENFFKDCKVAEVRFSSDRDGNFRGYGHVEFATEEDAQKALALNGEQLSGRELKLDMARERGAYTPGNERTPFQKAGNAQGSTMFVGGIDRNSGEDEVRSVLEKHFAACGELTRVSIPPDRDNGGLRGIAYIDFTDSAGLNKALELGGPEFNGYTLKVDEAKPRDNSNGGGGRSGGRSGGGRFGRSGGRDGGGRSGGRFGRSGGRDGGRGGRRGGFNSRPNLAAAGTGKKTTFDD